MELPRNLKIDSVSRLHPQAPQTISEHAPVSDAVALMRLHGVSCCLVVRDERLVGIFTERDLLTRVLASGRPLTTAVGDCMTAAPVTVGPKDSVRTAIRRMQTGGYRHLPVVEEDGRPLGVLSARQIMQYLAEHFPVTVFNQPPNPQQVPTQAEGA